MDLVGREVIIKSSDYAIKQKSEGFKGIITKMMTNSHSYDIEVRYSDGKKDDSGCEYDLFKLDEVEVIDDNCIKFEQEYDSTWVGKKETLINPKNHSLVFAQTGEGSKWVLYQDGEEVKGLRTVDIYADIESPTEHTIKFVTGATK